MKDNCSKHPTSILGESGMKILAGNICDLNYETLANLFDEIALRLYKDSVKDKKAGKIKLAESLELASNEMSDAFQYIAVAWEISKPFMETKK